MERRVKFHLKETVATIVGEEEFIEVAQKEIARQRKELEDYILGDPFFRLTFEPYSCPPRAPDIARRMADAGTRAGVGPMAAVAGAIAECAVEAMVASGAHHAIVDNGGDIALFLDHPVIVGIYAGDAAIRNLGLKIEPHGSIMGICTSSGRIGHSMSLGNAHAATVVSKSVALADAAATALGNAILDEDENAMEVVLNGFKIEGVEGALVIMGNHLGVSGNLPEMLDARVGFDLITMG